MQAFLFGAFTPTPAPDYVRGFAEIKLSIEALRSKLRGIARWRI
jgi:hypothetical protein